VARATKWLVENKQSPFFLWVQLQDPHAPTVLRMIARSRSGCRGGKSRQFSAGQALYDDALIAIASSQGESLGAHGEDGHGIFLYDETTHVHFC